MNKSKVLILLAAYNGKDYIRQMITSVLRQTYRNFKLVLSDDGSSDGTVQILEEYAQSNPDRVIHYRSGQHFGSAQKHFMHLLSCFHNEPYIMFCDQDDIWHPDKIEKTLAMMTQTEMDAETPALVHTDLRVVDGEGRQIAPSFCTHSAIDGKRLQMNQLLVQNVVTGCTVMINRSLAVLASRSVDTDAMLMHDWWLALLASCCGTAAFLDEATIDYRQHGMNSVGAKNVRSLRYRLDRLLSEGMRQSLDSAAVQAVEFLRVYGNDLSDAQKEVLDAFGSIRGASVIRRNGVYLKYGLLKKGLTRVCAQLLGL